MLIRKAGISNVGPIREPIELEFDPHVNVLIGPNSCGKTTVFNVLRHAESGVDVDYDPVSVHDSLLHEHEAAVWPNARDSYILLSDGIQYVLDVQGDELLNSDGYQPCHLVPIISIPSIRLTFPPAENVVAGYTVQDTFVESESILDFRKVFRMQDEYDKSLVEAIQAVDGSVNYQGQSDIRTDLAEIVLAGETIDPDNPEGEIDWAEDTIRRSWDGGDIHERRSAVIAVADRCAAEIVREIMQDASATTHEYNPPEGREHRGVTGVRYDYWGVSTTDATDDSLTIGDLSSGTQGPLMWIRYVAMMVNLQFIRSSRANKTAYVRERGPVDLEEFTHAIERESRGHVSRGDKAPDLWQLEIGIGAEEHDLFHEEWRKMPFVLLMDEIENHLHPTWQRRVIPTIKKYFPNVQLFVTTHSPFVVAGLKAGQVHKLHRDEAGVVRVETNSEDITGWTVEEILREFMEVLDPTDEETAISAAVLRWMRYQQPVVQDAEEWRQSKLAELTSIKGSGRLHGDQSVALDWLASHVPLRGDADQWWRERIGELEDKVSPDLESHGPIAAQNQLFLQQLEELLERYEQGDEEN
ncbi:MAG: AAA family ATPase [Chloroflexi bacterium]|nr:AAA family ATPase [Chloroflexota bacterium]